MFSTDEQQELRKIEDGLRAQDRGFGRRLTLQQGVLRWAAPGRQGFLLALAVVAAGALLAFGTAVTRRRSGTPDELLEATGISASQIAAAARGLVAAKPAPHVPGRPRRVCPPGACLRGTPVATDTGMAIN